MNEEARKTGKDEAGSSRSPFGATNQGEVRYYQNQMLEASLRILLSSLLALSFGSSSHATPLPPQELVLAFFGPDGIPDKNSHYTGEMGSHVDQPTVGQSLPKDVQISARMLSQSEDRCVFAVALSRNGQTQNWYAYLRRNVVDEWRLEAVRTLATTGILFTLLEELRKKPQRSVDEEWTFQNLLLVFKSDDELKAYVASNQKQLERIVSLVGEGRTEDAQKAAKDLFIASVAKTGSGTIELIIGGMVDNSVGIVFVPEGASPPIIDPSNYIYVEAVLGRWYIFKTT
jgi:hypothetical protein